MVIVSPYDNVPWCIYPQNAYDYSTGTALCARGFDISCQDDMYNRMYICGRFGLEASHRLREGWTNVTQRLEKGVAASSTRLFVLLNGQVDNV
jgi:hypothetical protein